MASKHEWNHPEMGCFAVELFWFSVSSLFFFDRQVYVPKGQDINLYLATNDVIRGWTWSEKYRIKTV